MSNAAGFSIVEVLMAFALFGVVVLSGVKLLDLNSSTSSVLRAEGEVDDIRALVRSSIDPTHTIGVSEGGYCDKDTPSPIALKRSDGSAFVAATDVGSKIGNRIFVRARCRYWNDAHEITIEHIRVKPGATTVDTATVALNPLTKAPSTWKPLFSRDPAAKSPPILLPRMCLTPGIRYLELLEPECGSLTAPNFDVFDGGSGRPSDPFLISRKEQLNCARRWNGSSFRLTSDIDLAGYLLKPIPLGCSWYSTRYKPPNPTIQIASVSRRSPDVAIFDGGGFKIKNLRQDGILDNLTVANSTTMTSGRIRFAPGGSRIFVYTASPSGGGAFPGTVSTGHLGAKVYGIPGLFIISGTTEIKNLVLEDVDIKGLDASLFSTIDTLNLVDNVQIRGQIGAIRQLDVVARLIDRLNNVDIDVTLSVGEKRLDPSFSNGGYQIFQNVSGVGYIVNIIENSNIRLRFTDGEKYSFELPFAGTIGGVSSNWYSRALSVSNVRVDIDTIGLHPGRQFSAIGGLIGRMQDGGVSVSPYQASNSTTISNSHVIGTINRAHHVGGFMGIGHNTRITGSTSNVSLSSSGTAGGFVGLAIAPISIDSSEFRGVSPPQDAIHRGGIVGGAFNWWVGRSREVYNSNPVPCYHILPTWQNFGNPLCIGNPMWNIPSTSSPPFHVSQPFSEILTLPVEVNTNNVSRFLPMVGETAP